MHTQRTTHSLTRISSLSAAALALGFGTVAFAETQTHADTARPETHAAAVGQGLRPASKADTDWTAHRLAGRKLLGEDGKELGTVKDFLVDTGTGRVAYAVVSTGGVAGIGDKLHLIPYGMLRHRDQDRDFQASIAADELGRAPVLNEEQFEENRIAVTHSEQQQIDTAFHSAVATNPDMPAGHLVRAAKLNGGKITSNGEKLGTVEGVVIPRDSTRAMALVKPEHKVTGADHGFLVPFERMKFEAGKHERVTTTLTQADLQAATRTGSTVSR